MNNYLTSRRRFLKQTTAGVAGLAMAGSALRVFAGSAGGVAIVRFDHDPLAVATAPEWAMTQLKQALESLNVQVRIISTVSEAPAGDQVVVIGSAGTSAAKEIIGQTGAAMPGGVEAFFLGRGKVSGRAVLLAFGNDARGLVYALLELTDRVLYSDSVTTAFNVKPALVEQPRNVTRSICRSFQSELEDKPWFNSREFWTEYLSTLAAERFNRFNLSFGNGYNGIPKGSPEVYLFFAYPFLVSVPEHPGVSARNLPAAERDANLQMLAFIGQECARRGLEFQLGLWSHAYAYGAGANYPIDGLTDDNHAAYCRDALAAILKTCTEITGVTFRVHNESGIPTGSYPFWKTVFEAFRMTGRTMEIDMHAKECYQEHIDAAVATGMRAVVSPKYWAEHQGLPYHQAALRQSEQSKSENTTLLNGQASRYGYSNFMKEDRNYGVLHRIWPGTQRLLLWGDPVFAAGFGRASSFCGSVGVEWNEPLSFKGRGGSGVAGGRCAYLDTTLNPDFDFQKFLYTYRVWGRLLYNPDSDPQTWRRYLAKEFGAAAGAVETALGNASRILLLVTTYHGASADNHTYWPEMYNNFPIIEGTSKPGDSKSPLGAASSFDPQLFLGIDAYVEQLLNGTAYDQNQYFPIEVAQWLEDLASAAAANLATARRTVPDPNHPAFRRLEADVAIQSGLGWFFARKFRSAVLWAIYQRTASDPSAKAAALDQYAKARQAWAELSAVATPVYLSNVAYGHETQMHGHWNDRLKGIDADIAAMEKAGITGTPSQPGSASAAMATVLRRPSRPAADCQHSPPDTFAAGQPLTIVLKTDGKKTSGVKLYYRHVNQADQWQVLEMEPANGHFQGTIPAEYTQTAYPLQYYFGLAKGNQGSVLYPGFDATLANEPYFISRLARKA